MGGGGGGVAYYCPIFRISKAWFERALHSQRVKSRFQIRKGSESWSETAFRTWFTPLWTGPVTIQLTCSLHPTNNRQCSNYIIPPLKLNGLLLSVGNGPLFTSEVHCHLCDFLFYESRQISLHLSNIWHSQDVQGCECICEKKSEIIWNAWKDVLLNALKVWNQIKIWTFTSLDVLDTILQLICIQRWLILMQWISVSVAIKNW